MSFKLRVRPRFTLAAMLVLITVIAIPLGYVAYRRAHHARTWAEFESLNSKGVMFYEENNSSDPMLSKAAFARNWWQTLIDEAPVFDQVVIMPLPKLGRPVCEVDDQDLQRLLYFTEIEGITIQEAPHVTDQGLRKLASMPNLRWFSASKMPQLDGCFLQGWEKAGELESLDLANLNSLQGEHLKALGKMSELVRFTIHSCPKITHESLEQVNMPPGLTYLGLGEHLWGTVVTSQTNFGDEAVARWLHQTHLKYLGLDTNITRAIASALARQTSLEAVRIANAPLVDEDLRFLGKCEKLRDIRLIGVPANGSFLTAFSNHASLYSLSLQSMPIVEDHLQHLHNFPKLGVLRLHYIPIEGEFLAFPGIPKPYTFDFWGTRFSEPGKRNLAKFSAVKRVTFPINWSALDMRRYPSSTAPTNITLCSLFSDEARSNSITIPTFYSPWIELDHPAIRCDQIDRCPEELMAPVIRLHALAKAEGEVLNQKRASKE